MCLFILLWNQKNSVLLHNDSIVTSLFIGSWACTIGYSGNASAYYKGNYAKLCYLEPKLSLLVISCNILHTLEVGTNPGALTWIEECWKAEEARILWRNQQSDIEKKQGEASWCQLEVFLSPDDNQSPNALYVHEKLD